MRWIEKARVWIIIGGSVNESWASVRNYPVYEWWHDSHTGDLWEDVGSGWLYYRFSNPSMSTLLCELQQAQSDVLHTQVSTKAASQQHIQPVASWCFLTGIPLSFQLHASSLAKCSLRGAVPLLHCSEGILWLPHFSSCSKMSGVFWAQPVGPRQSSCSWSPAPRLSLGGCWDVLALLSPALGCCYAPDSCCWSLF